MIGNTWITLDWEPAAQEEAGESLVVILEGAAESRESGWVALELQVGETQYH